MRRGKGNGNKNKMKRFKGLTGLKNDSSQLFDSIGFECSTGFGFLVGVCLSFLIQVIEEMLNKYDQSHLEQQRNGCCRCTCFYLREHNGQYTDFKTKKRHNDARGGLRQRRVGHKDQDREQNLLDQNDRMNTAPKQGQT